ncbi:MAG TPA: beta-N-acetylhexosaminidase [Gemmatimonas sp.]|nr:beta-N-acetylhexosaminidase [Gemmatimonas sp.]
MPHPTRLGSLIFLAVATLAVSHGCASRPAAAPAASPVPSAPAPVPAPAPAPAPVAVPAPASPIAPAAQPTAPSAALPSPAPNPPSPATLAGHRIVPLPTSTVVASGEPFTLAATTVIVVNAANERARVAATGVAELMAANFRKSTGFRLRVSSARGPAPAGAIVLHVGEGDSVGDSGAEGYILHISSDSMRLDASTASGLFYGVQTIRQLLPAGIESEQSALRANGASWIIPPGRIVDSPRFAWRGAMLDVARHFFTVDEVKQFIDILALYKLNTLHLHLADDQGWRIQINSWPKLTTVGGSTQVGGGNGGFYTKADYGSIVRYAAARHITVVPEIDMPGHTNAAIAAYPKLGCSRPTPGIYGGTQPAGVYTGIRVGWSTLCAEKAGTYKFVDDVIRELAAMTPGQYIHVGGDEVEVLSNAQYARFINRVQDIVTKHGKTMVGWEEIGKAKLKPTSIAQFWRSDTALLALRQGAKLIMSPGPRTYLDMKYTARSELGLRWAGYIELRTAYDWDPVTYAPGLSETSVLGVEGPLWSETIPNITAAQYLTMPRLPALAEVGWSAQSAREWEGFRTRIAAHARRWRLLGINYYPSPQVAWEQ